MKKNILIIAFLLLVKYSAYCQTEKEWQQDIIYLKTTIHSEYPHLLGKIGSPKWDSIADQFISNLKNLNNNERQVELVKLVAAFHIGHTSLEMMNYHTQGSQNSLKLRHFPIKFYQFTDGVFIIQADSTYKDVIGGKVLKVGNFTINEALEKIRPLVSYENEQGFLSNFNYYLTSSLFLKTLKIIDENEQLDLIIEKNGQPKKVKIDYKNNESFLTATGLGLPKNWIDVCGNENIPLWRKESHSYRYMEFIKENKLLYVRHSVTLNDDTATIKDYFDRVEKFVDQQNVQKFVLDLRMNSGGNNYLNKDIIATIIRLKKINKKGHFFCIIGRRTFSAAQNLVNELEKYTEVIFVGEPTSENVNFYGDVKTLQLPETKYNVNLSWIWWQNMDARDRRQATYPEINSKMSFDDYKSNIDPCMREINDFRIENSLSISISSMIESGKKVDEIKKYVQDYLNIHKDKSQLSKIEAEINKLGYKYMQSRNLLQAEILFQVNKEIFSQSANAYDSYAECAYYQGKLEMSKVNYEKAIELDKDEKLRSHAVMMIENINRHLKH